MVKICLYREDVNIAGQPLPENERRWIWLLVPALLVSQQRSFHPSSCDINCHASGPSSGVRRLHTSQAKNMIKQDQSCSICQRISLWRSGQNPYFIHEFEHSIFIVGDNQFHRGYSLLLLKEHIRELHELEPALQVRLFQELMKAGRAIVETFKPWKMNYSCYGNLDPHIHWHLFPRYDSEPDHRSHPWIHASEFKDYLIDSDTARKLGERIKMNLAV